VAKTIYGEGEFMKPFKLFIILPIVLAIFITPLGCTSELSYTAREWEKKQEEEGAQKARLELIETQQEIRQYLEARDNLVGSMESILHQKDYNAEIRIMREITSELERLYVPGPCEELHYLDLQWLRNMTDWTEKLVKQKEISDFAQDALDKKNEIVATGWLEESGKNLDEIEKLSDKSTELRDKYDREKRRLLREYDLY